ncbi:MAG: peptidylprolyl isomerase [Myxococcales bacterium]|nr:peptidylprolyl isomerase [Myxococcales bacterium]
MRTRAVLVTLVLGSALGCYPKTAPTQGQGEQPQQQVAAQAAPPARTTPHPALLDPSKATERAPAVYKVKLETTKGDVLLELHRDWAPNGADRFYNMVKIGYLDDVAFFRAIDGFMVQFGMHGDPKVSEAWKDATIEDDPVKESNARGNITFAMRGPNTRTTQLFINTVDNNGKGERPVNLDKMSFAPFGKVLEGMEVIDALYTGYGEGAPRGKGPDQGKITAEGNAYLRRDFPELDYIERATIVE